MISIEFPYWFELEPLPLNMADRFKPPKQWVLTENETISSYSNWQSNMLYNLSLCNDFAPFLETQWQKHGIQHRGLTDDGEDVVANERKTAVQKKIVLERMLGLIAQFTPSLLRNDIIKRSTSLSWIWQRVRKHYNFSQSEVNFLNLVNIKLKSEERYETFYQRLMAHIEDNLLTVGSGLMYDGNAATEDEIISPTTDRLVVYMWLYLIDPRLPAYVGRVYAHDLQTKTLKDIQPQLSQSMEALITELNAQEEISVHYTKSSFRRNTTTTKPNRDTRQQFKPPTSKSCIICKAANRKYQGHDLSTCFYLSKFEKAEAARALQITLDDEVNEIEDCQDISAVLTETLNLETTNTDTSVDVRKVESSVSPYFYAFYEHHPCKIIVDTGATSSVVSQSFLRRIGISPSNTLHTARGADKNSLNVKGEIQLTLTFGKLKLPITALVLNTNDCDILAGAPFGKEHDVHVHLKAETITIGGTTIWHHMVPKP